METKMLRELKKGSEDALVWFIERYNGYVCAIIHNIIGASMDRSDVEEVASDVFFALWQHADAVRAGHVQGYLAALARNKAKNKYRELGKALPLEDDLLVVDIPDPESLQCYSI